MKMGVCCIPVVPKLPHKIPQEDLIPQEMCGNITQSYVVMIMGVCGIPVVPRVPHKVPHKVPHEYLILQEMSVVK